MKAKKEKVWCDKRDSCQVRWCPHYLPHWPNEQENRCEDFPNSKCVPRNN